MVNPFLGEVIMFGGNFAPRGWALCNGQLLPISQYSALFSILGTIYGGDGRTTFALPDFRGRLSINPRSGPGLSSYREGERGGQESVYLTISEIPSHNHLINAVNTVGTSTSPTNHILGDSDAFDTEFAASGTPTTMKSDMVRNTGNGLSHTNIQPFLCVNYIIALQGTYPSRS